MKVSTSNTVEEVELQDAYAAAWAEWAEEDAEIWDRTAGDGIVERPPRYSLAVRFVCIRVFGSLLNGPGGEK